MIHRIQRGGTLVLALVLALAPLQGLAIAPALLLLVKQVARQAATSMFKDAVLSSLNGMGCKGIALSNALAAFDRRGGGALVPRLPAGALPPLPAGMAPGLPGGVVPGAGALPQLTGVPPEMLAKLNAMMPGAGQMPPGLDADQMAAMARMQQAMGQPLSPPETLATIDELFELGFLPPAIQTELKQCMVLVPAAIPALGSGMGMLKPMIPQLRAARDELRALTPAEQDEVAAALMQELKGLPADQREALLEHIDSGFFPPRVSQGVKAGLAAK